MAADKSLEDNQPESSAASGTLVILNKSEDLSEDALSVGNASAQLRLALQYLEQQRFEESKRAAIHALMLDPELTPATLILASALLNLNEHRAAASQLEKAVRQEPENINTIRRLVSLSYSGLIDFPDRYDRLVAHFDRIKLSEVSRHEYWTGYAEFLGLECRSRYHGEKPILGVCQAAISAWRKVAAQAAMRRDKPGEEYAAKRIHEIQNFDLAVGLP